ncbi:MULTISPECIES: DNA polymerase I [unclassified Frondihabitans]|uniref:DNA polymerase I n=1 Tax=unclassified Frondihabitans TaxID=2626248 RepID=UPI000F4DCA8A|nr:MULTISPECIES: DNA polymerase I [unclassified Frondihabitans]RPE75061.1 DNA polymerase I [Frondihabitans sp. PhB153]RPF04304.1 DNA polymerase I [Frondihabitans sp. PhB161]
MPSSEKPTLLVIDGHSLAFRAFYALPIDSFVNRDGQHTNAIHGFISMLLNLLKNEKPTHLAVAFDISRYSFRTREYPEYKGTRNETPVEFVGQIPLLEEALHAMGITTITKEDFEADDILATLAARGSSGGYKVFVVSGDRDAIQMVNDDVTLLYPSARGVTDLTRYDRDKVFERYGIEPHQYPEVAALVGETSDNLIGVDKVGEKTAVKWINQFGSLDEVVAHRDEIKGVVGDKFREQYDRAVRNRKLNRLVTDVDLPVGPDDLERRPIDVPAVREVFDRLQFRTLLERVVALAEGGAAGSSAPTAGVAAEPEAPSGPVVPVVRTLVDEELAHWLRTHAAADKPPVGVSVEYGSDGTVTGLGIAASDDSVYIPWAAGRGDYVALEAWLDADSPKVVHDAKRAYKALKRVGLTLTGLVGDPRIAAWLLRPGRTSFALADLVYEHLAERMPVADPDQLVPADDAGGAAAEAWFALRVSAELDELLDEGSRGVLRDLELPLVPVLGDMELTGVATDRPALRALSARLADTAATLAAEAFEVIGREVNLGSPKQLQEVLFEQLDMPKTRSMKTGYSTDAASLADLQEKHPHPFLGLLLKHRDATKLRQIIDTLDKAIDDNGRIHTTYDQTGTTTGRISSIDPNLQNIPVKTAVGHEIRATFQHGPDYQTLLTADYSQIEMRIMAHLSGDEGLITAFTEGEDLHRFVGARIFGVEPSEVSPAMRTKVKAMSYGLAYGLSAFGLSKQLRIETAEAKQLMTDYFSRFGAVREYLRNVVEQARDDGYTETIFGRRRPFADLKSSNRVLRENAERAALNAPIQGSAADIMKRAMLGVRSEIDQRELQSRVLLQVHDELIVEVAEGEAEIVEDVVRRRMGSAAELRVPLDVSVGLGESWDAAAH